MTTELTTDYLVIGSGAIGMAFTDTLLAETDASVIIVDRFAKPGGHWNNAYPFVTLHQPSQFYGVAGRELSKGRVDQTGLNKGLGDLATGAEILAYFDAVMRHDFLPTGRVEHHPLCNYEGNGTFTNKLSGESFHVTAGKTVDCTHLNTSVPSTHTPSFDVRDGVRFMPLNDLPRVTDAPEGFVVIGGGKTGMDAIIWLLEQRVDPDTITWVVSRDGWLLNRKNTQPSMEFFEQTMGAQAAQFESIANATSIDNMYERLEESGYFIRLDTDVWPTMFHGATISEAELEQLRRVKNVIRMGHVQSISTSEIVLVGGTVPTTPNHLFVDCSASAVTNLTIKPVFQGDLITPQTVRAYQPAFSSSVVAYVEANYGTDEEKNALCAPVPLPNSTIDFLPMTLASMTNQYNWGQDSSLRRWMRANRLDGFSKLVQDVPAEDTSKREIVQRMMENAMPAAIRLSELIAELPAEVAD